MMTLLFWSFVDVEGKTRTSGENNGRYIPTRMDSLFPQSGIAALALNDPRNLTSSATRAHKNNRREK
jgi:hypothetical protein